MKRYLGLCELVKAPEPWNWRIVFASGVVAAAGLNTFFNIAAGNSLGQNWLLAAVAGSTGCVLATEAHTRLNKYLSSKGIGLTRGTNIVRKAQSLIYALPVAASLVFNAVVDKDLKQLVFAEGLPSRLTQIALAQAPSQYRPS